MIYAKLHFEFLAYANILDVRLFHRTDSLIKFSNAVNATICASSTLCMKCLLFPLLSLHSANRNT